MVLNYIWVGFFIAAFVVAVLRLLAYFFRDNFSEPFLNVIDPSLTVFADIVDSTFASAETSIEIIISLITVMALWLGIMKIGEDGGAVRALGRLIAPFIQALFPKIPKDHPANGAMVMNFSANMLGLDNAATPLGLKAMNELQELNPDKRTASNAQIMFLVLNTSGLTIVPVSVMALREGAGAESPTDVFLPILLTTFCATVVGLFAVMAFQRINFFKPVILLYLGGAMAVVAGMVMLFNQHPEYAGVVGNAIIFLIIVSFILLALKKKINIYDSFIEGAKDGFGVAIKIIPYLVAILVAVGVFRASGGMDLLMDGIRGIFLGINYVFNANIDLKFVDALPTALMKPLSGGGARGMAAESFQNFGVDSFVARLASTFQGSTETTFYVLAVYFGSVNIRNTRYALGAGLIADLAGIIAAIFIAYFWVDLGLWEMDPEK